MPRAKRNAFTLIELLIVVAIIAILAAIAVPNFLEAQTRAKVSRAKADMRSIGNCLEAYRVDFNAYPPIPAQRTDGLFPGASCPFGLRLKPITTPMAYITSNPFDPFQAKVGGPVRDPTEPIWQTYVYNRGDVRPPPCNRDEWLINSAGPDLVMTTWSFYDVQDMINWESPEIVALFPTGILPARYDPTNGTISIGELFRWGPGGTVIN